MIMKKAVSLLLVLIISATAGCPALGRLLLRDDRPTDKFGRQIGVPVYKDNQPIFTSTTTANGLMWDFESKTEAYLDIDCSKEKNKDKEPCIISLDVGKGKALAVGIKPDASVAISQKKNTSKKGGKKETSIQVTSLTDSLVPLISDTVADAFSSKNTIGSFNGQGIEAGARGEASAKSKKQKKKNAGVQAGAISSAAIEGNEDDSVDLDLDGAGIAEVVLLDEGQTGKVDANGATFMGGDE